MTTLRYVAAALVTAGTLFTSCKVENIEIPEVEQYTREFYKQFGIVDPDHDWTTATRVKAQVSGSIANKASIISVYTDMPGAKNASIAARFTGDTSEFEFDFSNTATLAYVEIRDHNNLTTYGGYLPIRNGVLEITDGHNRSRADGAVPYAYLLNDNPALGTFYIKGPGQDLIAKMGGVIQPSESQKDRVEILTETVSFVGSWDDSRQIEKEVFSGLNNYNNVTLHFTLKANNSDDVEQTENTDKNTIDFKIVHMGDGWPTLECLSRMSGFNEEYSEVKLDAKDYAEPKEISLKLTSSDISNIVSNGMAFQGLYYTVGDVYIIGENEGSEYPGVKMTDVFDLYGLAQSNVSNFNEFEKAYVKGTISSDADSDDGSMTVADLSPIVGVDGVFNEKASPDATGAFLCNLDKYSTLLRPQNGVQYTVSESSEVSLEFFYGSTSYYNSFGYFYYDANDSQEEILKKPKFLLMYDARPSVNIQIKDPQNINFTPNDWTYWDLSPYTTYSYFDGEDYPDPENGYMNTGNSWAASKQLDRRIEVYDKNTEIYETTGDYSRFKSTIHKLVYYPVNPDGSLGAGTYTFPAGTRIGFFIITNGKSSLEYSDALPNSINSGRISFSLPWMNKAIGNTMSTDHTHADDSSSTYEDGDDGWTAFVTYLWNGKYVLGAEDGTPGGDRDMNDVLFYVNGNISSDEPIEDLSTQDVKVQSWMLAVEDLGGAYDYDFNDLVIGISHYSTNVYENGSLSSTTPANYFTVTGIAAGGTLPVYLKYNGKQIGGEFHSWFGLSSDRVHNANNFNGVAEKRYHVACDDNFSLSRNENKVDTEGTGLEGFSVEVKRNDNTTYEVTNTNYGTTTAPQMILFPGQWRHPKEGVHITNAYSDKFLQWVKNHEDENAKKWVNERKSGMTVNHQWSGENAPKDGKYSYKYEEVK